MRLFYLIFLCVFCFAGCQPADKTAVSSVTLLQDNQLWLRLSPGHAPVETPLTLQLTAAGLTGVSAELTGVSMYMGRIPLRFSRIDDSNWQAEFLLGACSDPKMQWQLVLQLDFANGQKRTLKQQFQSSWR